MLELINIIPVDDMCMGSQFHRIGCSPPAVTVITILLED